MAREPHKFRAEVGWLFCRGITVSDSSVDAPSYPSSPKELKSQGVKCFDWSSLCFGKDHRVFPRLLWDSYSAGISMVLWLAWDQVYKVALFTLLKEVLWYFFPRGLAESFDKHRPMEKLNRAESSPILHTSLTLRMQSGITTDAHLRNLSETLPALLMDEQEISIRHLEKGIPGCLCVRKPP